ncbi:MAG: 50S ribosomal protein L21 [Myxococcota bacterium]|nr:50S ribosomal protein L21 [Myxococcota bacterium]
MFAVIRTGGKQHRVISGERLKIEKLVGDVGAEFAFDDILMVGGEELKIGQPLVEGASVKAKIVAHGRGKKLKVFKKKRRKGFHKMIGHRQSFTEVEITEISA